MKKKGDTKRTILKYLKLRNEAGCKLHSYDMRGNYKFVNSGAE